MILSLASVGGVSLANAQAPVPITHLTPDTAAKAGVAIPVVAHRVQGGTLFEAGLQSTSSDTSSGEVRAQASRMLAVAADGTAAIVQAPSGPSPDLVLAYPDGSQDRIGLPGVLGAAFAPAGWLAAVDVAGVLWRIEAASGRVEALASGPYAASLAFAGDGALLLIEASSVDAPFASRLVRFDPDGGQSQVLLDDPGFVFSAGELADGSVAAIVHPFGGGVAMVRPAAIDTQPAANLDSSAIDTSFDSAGTTAVFALAEDGIYLQDLPSGTPRRIGDGELPRIARDGSAVLALRGTGSVLLDRNGSVLARYASRTVGWAGCDGRCQP